MQNDLTKIKKYYGEKMMHLCAKLFPTVIETDGLLFKIISSKFAYSKLLYDDIIKQDKIREFQNYILSFVEMKKNNEESDFDPYYLMEKAGYNLYECKSDEDIQKFKKYYRRGEELCTFNSDRTKDHYVFFAVKKDVEKINREDFLHPKRQDEYGTSVISIQFTKGKYNNLSIKNRYNHTVLNADSTFSNNLDNIILGLTDSFRKKYNLNIFFTDYNFELNGYCYAQDGRFYKYNHHIGDVYYCVNNFIIDIKKIKKFEKEKYLLIDYFIIDLINKKILLYDNNIKDSFINLPVIKKITITNHDYGKIIKILMDNNYIYLTINKANQIISFESDIKNIDNGFLCYNKTLKEFSDDNLTTVGNDFLVINNSLNTLNLPNLEIVGDNFLSQNAQLNNFTLPKLKRAGASFLRSCSMEVVSLPSLEIVGSSFLASNHELMELILPSLREAGCFFGNFNTKLKDIHLPNLERVSHHFLTRNRSIESISFPKLSYIDDYFIFDNRKIKMVNLPKVETIGDYFLQNNIELKEINLPNILQVGKCFLYENYFLNSINLPLLTKVGSDFLANNNYLTKISLPKLLIIGENCLMNNNTITEVILPNLKICGNNFLPKVSDLSTIALNTNIHPGQLFLNAYFKNMENDLEKRLVKKIKN